MTASGANSTPIGILKKKRPSNSSTDNIFDSMGEEGDQMLQEIISHINTTLSQTQDQAATITDPRTQCFYTQLVVTCQTASALLSKYVSTAPQRSSQTAEDEKRQFEVVISGVQESTAANLPNVPKRTSTVFAIFSTLLGWKQSQLSIVWAGGWPGPAVPVLSRCKCRAAPWLVGS